MVTNARTIEQKGTRDKAAHKEAAGFFESAYKTLTTSLWMVAWIVIAVIEVILALVSAITSLVSAALGIVSAIAAAISSISAKVSGIISDTKDELKESWLSWKQKKDEASRRAEAFERMA